MKRDEPDMEDEFRSEYDLKSLRVRKLGCGRKSFGEATVRLNYIKYWVYKISSRELFIVSLSTLRLLIKSQTSIAAT
ncbi:MAG TPA: hypothetical protein V6D33_05155 [Cyanophyceae cyanobacterium]